MVSGVRTTTGGLGMNGTGRLAQVAVAVPRLPPLTYKVPEVLKDLQVGDVVAVPVGGRTERGYIIGWPETTDVPLNKLKEVAHRLSEHPVFDEAQLGFFTWMSDYYLQPLGQVIQTAVPSDVAARVIRGLVATDLGVDRLAAHEVDAEDALVLREVIRRSGYTRQGLMRMLREELERDSVKRGIDRLLRKKWIAWHERTVGGTRGKVKVAVWVEDPPKEGARARLGSRMNSVLERLKDGEMEVPELVKAEGSGARPALKRLVELGRVRVEEREQRDILAEAAPHGGETVPELNAEQKEVLGVLTAPDREPQPHLLYGVTGSGKTEVFLGAARSVIERGAQVLVLVPEIGLTPQLVGRFRARFNEGVAVLHSGLTGSARLAHWRAIRAGEVRVVVGARSALFAPFQDLGLIVVDEEHDDSYKQSEGVPYNARDLAVVLGKKKGCSVILASATPSLESWRNATEGRYTLLRLPNRATPKPVPHVELVDMKGLDSEGTRPLLAPQVVDALEETFADGGQAILLFNRRGYATMVECTACGSTYECPNCGITMTLHKRFQYVCCHYCGLKRSYGEACPVCRGVGTMEEIGKGTERVEEVLRGVFPGVKIARLDADTTAKRGAIHQILEQFREGETQLLVGTQLVAKGHDFPGVRTAVVVSADHGFRLPDFRSAERTYALLVQLAGRAGRGDEPGRVFVQTFKPDHYVLDHLNDVDAFLKRETHIRQRLGYPPFTRTCLVRVEGTQLHEVRRESERLGRELRKLARSYEGLYVMGPTAAALPRLVGRWRQQIFLRGDHTGAFRAFLRASLPILHEWSSIRGLRVAWDVDPRHLL